MSTLSLSKWRIYNYYNKVNLEVVTKNSLHRKSTVLECYSSLGHTRARSAQLAGWLARPDPVCHTGN